MYAYFNGILEEISKDNLIIDVNGVGYNIRVYDADLLALPALGSPLKIYTYTNVGEDKFELFGFLAKEELELFKLLISVNGVGPKSAQAMLATLGVSDIEVAIATEDAKTIAKTPGLGAKTAGRLINDLKDKIKTGFLPTAGTSVSKKGSAAALLSPVEEECVTALVSLGYSKSNAEKAVSQCEADENTTSEDLLKAALKNIMFL